MSKRKGRKALTSPAPTTQGQDFEAFSFGEPSPVLDKREILDYIECTGNGKWYEPPINFDGLARSVRAAVHHSSPMFVKRNILASTFIPHPMLSQQEFSRYALDYLVFGNAFLEVRKNQLGEPLRLQCSPAKYARRGVEQDTYWFVQDWKEPHQFAPGSVFHLIEPDINQELYGLPEYLSALNSAWLNAVPPQVLPERRTCRLYPVYDRRGAEYQRRRQNAPSHARHEGAGQLPQPVYVRAER